MAENAKAQAEWEKRSAALSSVVAAILLTSLKLVVGLLTGSLGILAEAAHSALDLVAALVTFFAVRLSDRPPDEQHHYGHGKIENLSALIETLLLLITCVWIIYEAIQRLFFKTVEIEASIWAFVVMIVSIVVDISRSRMLYSVARKHKSQALEADALHFSTDIWSSSVVIIGLGLVWLSERLGPTWGWLASADAVAAMVVAGIVVFVSLQLGKRAVSVLLDTAPPGLVERIGTEAGQVPGVGEVEVVRVRQAGASTFADLTVTVDRSISLEEAHEIAAAVEERVVGLVHMGDVVVHIEPAVQDGESLPQTVGAIASKLGLRAHNIHAHEVRGHYFVDLHAEVPSHVTLGEAHQQVNRLEEAIRQELPYVSDVQTHMEPRSIPVAGAEPHHDAGPELRAQIMKVVEGISGLADCHEIHFRRSQDGHDVVVHCLADPNLPITEAHRLADEAEKRIQAQVPGITQILVHVEPEGEG
ncbi:MAG: cation-efflux pump [Anaerolineae bacterium]|nr:cation-efflux pump [Anaerolineae bacterium]